MTRHLERIRSIENGDEWHVQNGDARPHCPRLEVQAVEPILLLWTRVDDKQPKAKLWNGQTR